MFSEKTVLLQGIDTFSFPLHSSRERAAGWWPWAMQGESGGEAPREVGHRVLYRLEPISRKSGVPAAGLWEGHTDPKIVQQGYPGPRNHLAEPGVMLRTGSYPSGLPFWALGEEQLHA